MHKNIRQCQWRIIWC